MHDFKHENMFLAITATPSRNTNNECFTTHFSSNHCCMAFISMSTQTCHLGTRYW